MEKASIVSLDSVIGITNAIKNNFLQFKSSEVRRKLAKGLLSNIEGYATKISDNFLGGTDKDCKYSSFKSSLFIATSLISYAMKLILCDMNTLSLISTVTPGNPKTVIEHIYRYYKFWFSCLVLRPFAAWLDFLMYDRDIIR